MQIYSSFHRSYLKKVLTFLFIDKNDTKNHFASSKVLQFLNRLCMPKTSLVLLFASIISFWYENLFVYIGLGFISTLNFGTILLFLAFVVCDKSKIKSSKPIMYLLIFAVSLFVSALISGIFGMPVGLLFDGLVIFSQFILAYIIGSTYPWARLSIINVSLVLMLPLALLGIYQGIFGVDTSALWVSSSEVSITKRAFGFFGSPNILGSLAMLGFIISVLSWMNEKKKSLYIVSSILLAVALVFTYSRSAWIGLGTGLFIVLVIKNWRYIFLVFLGLFGLIIPRVSQRISAVFSEGYLNDATLDGRIWSLNNGLSIFKTSPVFGTGPGSYGGQTAVQYASKTYLEGFQNGYVALAYTDNQWLQILVQTGLFGFLAILGFFVSNICSNLKRYDKTRSNTYLVVTALTIAVIVNGLFANVLEFGAVSVFAGLLLSLGENV